MAVDHKPTTDEVNAIIETLSEVSAGDTLEFDAEGEGEMEPAPV